MRIESDPEVSLFLALCVGLERRRNEEQGRSRWREVLYVVAWSPQSPSSEFFVFPSPLVDRNFNPPPSLKLFLLPLSLGHPTLFVEDFSPPSSLPSFLLPLSLFPPALVEENFDPPPSLTPFRLPLTHYSPRPD